MTDFVNLAIALCRAASANDAVALERHLSADDATQLAAALNSHGAELRPPLGCAAACGHVAAVCLSQIGFHQRRTLWHAGLCCFQCARWHAAEQCITE